MVTGASRGEAVGLEAVFENKEFQKGLNTFIKGLQVATASTERTATKMNTTMDAASKGAKSLGASGVALGNIIANILTGAFKAFLAVLKTFINLFLDATKVMIGFGIESIKTAGRTQEMKIVLQVLGNRIGKTAEEMQGYVDGVKEMGIRTDAAQQLVASFTKRNLDLSKAQDLARVAQDAAVVAMKDSSTVLSRLTEGIERQSTVILKTNGIFVDATDAYEKFAEANDLVAETLTGAERQAAFLNATLADGANLAGAYEAAMLSPAKRLRSLERVLFEIKNVAGEPFQDAFLEGVLIMEDFSKGLLEAVSAGGQLRESLQQVGAFGSVVLSELRGFLNTAREEILKFGPDVGERFVNFASDALIWGVNISTQFAAGIIEGAAIAITAAMNFISSLLTFWLSPGSPPKVAPNLNTWGAKAFGEFLKGMTDASLAPLKELAKILEAEVGNKTLLEQQLALVKATKALTNEEKRLQNVRDKRIKGQNKLRKLIERQNKLIRSGASDDELKFNLKNIKAQKQIINNTAKEEEEVQNRIDTKKEEIKIIREQISLQRQLITEIGKLIRAQEQATGIGIPEQRGEFQFGGVPIIEPLTNTIDQAFEDMKAKLQEKLGGLFDPITTAWEESIKPTLDNLQTRWDEFTALWKQAWDEKIFPIIEGFVDLIPPELTGNLDTVEGKFLAAAVASAILLAGLAFLVLVIAPLILLIVGMIIFVGGLIKTWKILKLLWEDGIIPAIETILTKMAETDKKIQEFIDGALSKVIELWDDFKESIAGVIGKLEEALGWIKDVAKEIAGMVIPKWFKPGSPSPWEMSLGRTNKLLKNMANTTLPGFSKSLTLSQVPVPSGNAVGNNSVVNNNQQDNLNVNFNAPTGGQSPQRIADSILFANEVRKNR